jgi:hypothetical protein
MKKTNGIESGISILKPCTNVKGTKIAVVVYAINVR